MEREVKEFIRLRKEKESIELRIKVLKEKGKETDELEKRLEEINDKMSIDVDEKLLELIPEIKKLNELNKEIDSLPSFEIVNALKEREGPIWEKIMERRRLWERVMFMLDEIAHFIAIVSNLGDDDLEIVERILQNGGIEEPVESESADEIAKAIRMLGIPGKVDEGVLKKGDEERKVLVIYNGKRYWMNETKAKEFEDLVRELESTGLKIQVKNAERQVKKLTEGEEKEFEDLQSKYLELLKKRDALLKEIG